MLLFYTTGCMYIIETSAWGLNFDYSCTCFQIWSFFLSKLWLFFFFYFSLWPWSCKSHTSELTFLFRSWRLTSSSMFFISCISFFMSLTFCRASCLWTLNSYVMKFIIILCPLMYMHAFIDKYAVSSTCADNNHALIHNHLNKSMIKYIKA